MYKIFISDLHLEETHPEIADIFLYFLNSYVSPTLSLYILGDFFESWIGDDDNSSFNLSIIKALKSASSIGSKIFLMHGNRDFLIGKRFLRATGCNWLPDEFVVDIYGTPTLLMHGDTLCTEDKKYLKFRRKSRSWWYQKLILLKSLKSRRELAARMRAASRDHTRNTESYIMDVTQAEVERKMLQHKVLHLIHGHTHREGQHQFKLLEHSATRTVLGAWHTKGSAFICTENKKELINL